MGGVRGMEKELGGGVGVGAEPEGYCEYDLWGTETGAVT